MLRDNVCWHRFYGVGALFYLLTFQSIPGCEGTNDKGPPPVGPDIRGRWSGVYYRTDSSGRTSLTASIQQEGEAVTITTDKEEGRAGLLTGTIYENGDLDMTDAFDGQEWTSFFGPVTETHILLADYVSTPSPEEPEPPLYILDLTR
ncbi:MAG: hypothetical protein KJ726_03930 [Verrucomicrobia bacterium]|nr:hypothetical protein [Verrucomicrobiota bacterium]